MMKKIVQIYLLIFMYTSSEEIEYNEYQDVIDEIDEIIDYSLTNTQLTIHSVSRHVLKAFDLDMFYKFTDEQQNKNVSSDMVALFVKINMMLECHKWRILERKSITVDIPLNRWMKNLKTNLVVLESEISVVNNSIDRLVMNGSRNFTEKCDFAYTEEQLYDCLQSAVDEVSEVCENLLDKLSMTLSYFRTIMCLSLDFIHFNDR